MKLRTTSLSRILTPGILLGTIISATIVLTAYADPTNCTPPPSGLVGWWRGDGDCLDAAGTGNGTLQGGATFALGEVGGAFSFNPDSGTMIVPDSSNLRLTNQLTIEAWINARSISGLDGYALVSKVGSAAGSATGTDNFGYQFGLTGNTLFGQFSSPGDSWWQWPSARVTSGGLIATGVWYHVAWTYDQSAMKLYCNGQPVATNVIGPKAISATSSNLRLSGDDNNHVYFDGLIDEASVYNRALADSEIQAIYSAGSAGKCVTPVAPSIFQQPGNQVVTVGANVSFSVVASGTAPLAYQWQFNGTNVAGAVTSTLTLTNVQDYDAGSYAVVVTNAYGTVTSTNAVLTVNPAPPCVPPPAGLIGWWSAEGNANDVMGASSGTLSGGVTFTNGEVGQAFDFNPAGGTAIIPDSPSLRLTNQLTIEAWINARSSDAVVGCAIVSKISINSGNNGYQFILVGDTLQGLLNSPGLSWPSQRIISGPIINMGEWYHVAFTYDQSAMKLYCNGQPVATNVIGAHAIATSPSELRISGADDHGYFDGLIDEPSVYNRALSDSEIAAIYNAGSSGKCGGPIPPHMVSQPMDQTATVGGNVTFSATAGGTPPLSFQWQFNGTNITGATATTLTLTNLQFSQTGSYALVVTNLAGSIASSNAVLTVNPAPVCAPAPAGLVSWWPAEGNANDIAGSNNGTLPGGVTFTSGVVGQAFNLNGLSQYVEVGNPSNLNPAASFSIEGWIYPRQDRVQVIMSKWADSPAHPNQRSYVFQTYPGQALLFGISDWAHQLDAGFHAFSTANNVFGLSAWSHVAAVYDQATGARRMYVNGVKVAERIDTPITVTNSTAEVVIGGALTYGPADAFFDGLIDELSFYAKALSPSEIAAIYAAGVSGKCALPPSGPYIYAQPANQVVTVGGNVTFSLAVGGTPPLSYQWSFGGSALGGATNATLTLTNVQSSQAGNYSVVITNLLGTASSSNATLSVNFPAASVRVVNVANAHSGAPVTLPVSLAANGNENGFGFSLNFDPTKLTYVSTALGSGASGATLLTNAAQATSGKLGVLLTLPPDQTFAAGTQEVVEVTFMAAVRTYAFSATVSFGDVPIVRELSDAAGNVLAATYASGLVSIQAATDFEGDLAPRPNGDKAVTVSDWVLAGRYAARLDYPTNAAEFQRADCAPRSTLGDGAITVIDWVQVGLYAAHLDPPTVAGGPTSEVHPGVIISGKHSGPNTPRGHSPPPSARLLEVADTMVIQGLTGTASVQLESLGDENAVGFSLLFDPAAVNYVGASVGSASNGVTLFVNDSQAGTGRLGFVLGLATGKSFVSGTRELVKVTFRAADPDQGNCVVSFADQPVPCEVAGTNALRLAADYVNGTITVNPLPSLKIAVSGTNITLVWPIWATNFGLQALEGGLPPAVPWTNLKSVPVLTTNESIATLPLAATNVFYRLHQQ